MKDLTKLFNPEAVAVIGGSAQKGKVGYIVVDNMKTCGYEGKIYPVNTKLKENETTIQDLPAYRTVKDIPDNVDLAIMSIPSKFVNPTLIECGEKGIKNVVILTAGFKEIGGEGVKLEEEMAEIAHKYDINILGPNSIGNIDAHTPLNSSFCQMMPNKGNIAFVSQSGAMMVAIMDWSVTSGIGFSKVVSLGNKADMTEIDVIENLADDDETAVILCYLEGISEGEKFLKVMKEVSKKKPIVILKSGSSQAGAQAVSSHTGSLAGNDFAFDAAFENCGVIRAHTMKELFDYGLAFSKVPLPTGKNVAVITNAGGGGVVTADIIEELDLKLVQFDEETTKKLKEAIPDEGSASNPIDVLGDAPPERYQKTLEIVLENDEVDSLIIMSCPTASNQPIPITEEILKAQEKFHKPILVVNMGGPTYEKANKILRANHIPTYVFPEAAVNVVKALERYATIKEDVKKSCLNEITNTNKENAEKILKEAKDKGRKALLGSEAYQIAKEYGISAAPIVLTKTKEEAGIESEKMGFPVVLKIASDKILHKTDIGGVQVNIESKEEAEEIFDKIMDNAKKAHPDVIPDGIEVQKMMPHGHEVLIGMVRDEQFGPTIGFGMGGIYVNLIEDVCFKLGSGITNETIEDQINNTKISKVLKGYRGDKASDIEIVKDTIKRVTKLTLDLKEIEELDINPIFVYEDGASALDIKMTLK